MIAALVGEGDFVIDIGADIGLVTIPAARAVGSMGQVIARIEPASHVVDLLCRTLALNGVSDRVTVHPCAAGEAVGATTLNLGATSGHSSLLPLADAVGSGED